VSVDNAVKPQELFFIVADVDKLLGFFFWRLNAGNLWAGFTFAISSVVAWFST